MNHIQSPRTCDASIEEEILAKGLTAPRILPMDVEANIASVHYFTASEGVMASIEVTGTTPGWPSEDISTLIPKALDLLTMCVLVLKNGFTVTGESACASPENFDANVGRRIARANAVNKVWPLMGYALKEKLSQAVPA